MQDHNILIVSEKDQKAYLPYFASDVETMYKNSSSKFNSMKDVIENYYIVPLKRFEHPIISRFQETLNLVLHKEKKSIFYALDLAFELMFKAELNPIIIAGCRNLEELDIYIDCLEENELFDFRCFEIRFEVCPNVYKKQIYIH